MIVVEGHTSNELIAFADMVLFLVADAETCLARRISRRNRSPGENQRIERYFRHFVWPAHERLVVSKLEQLQRRPNGTKPLVAVVGASSNSDACTVARHAQQAMQVAGLFPARCPL